MARMQAIRDGRDIRAQLVVLGVTAACRTVLRMFAARPASGQRPGIVGAPRVPGPNADHRRVVPATGPDP
jgi:hypothetical protein